MPTPFTLSMKTLLVVIGLIVNFSGLAEARSVTSLLEIRRENVVIQKWDLSCGAAALATLLNYQQGDFVTEKEIAKSLMSRPEYIKYPGLVTARPEGFTSGNNILLTIDKRAD